MIHCTIICAFAAFIILGLTGFAHSYEIRLIDVFKGDNQGDQLGRGCQRLGDINGDGLNDFLFGRFEPLTTFVYLGGPHPFDYSPVMTIENCLAIYTPYSLGPIGDIDCDGIEDFFTIVGTDKDGYIYYSDTLRLYKGLENLDTADYLVFLSAPLDEWLPEITGGGDNNNDGKPDIWMFNSASLVNNDTIWGYAGCDVLDTVPDYKIIKSILPDNKYPQIHALCNSCDLNGDSIPEIIYGQRSDGSPYPGRVCIVWGGPAFSDRPDLVFYAPKDTLGPDQFGMDIACLGDITGDGIDDLFVHQSRLNYIYHGSQSFDTIPDMIIDHEKVRWVDNVGDINNDGWNDVLLVFPFSFMSEIAFLYCGPDMDTIIDIYYSEDDILLAQSEYPGPMTEIGKDFAVVGDVDGDNIDDFLIRANSVDIDAGDHGWAILIAGWDGYPVDVDVDDELSLPELLELHQNYPNPFNSGTSIEFTLPRSGYTEIKIFNTLGQLVATPFQKQLSSGEHRIIWDGRDESGNITATGIYFYQVISGDFIQTRKMVLLR